jgi:UDP-N-acetylmuramate dehydrogenase
VEEALRAELVEALRPLVKRKELTENAPMSEYTTLSLGGPAELLCEVTSADQLLEILRIANRLNVPVNILGNGSNLLVRDGGWPGLTLHFGDGFAEVTPPVPLPDGRYAITAQAGAPLAKLSAAAADAALSGLEFSLFMDARFMLREPAVPRLVDLEAENAAAATRREFGLG